MKRFFATLLLAITASTAATVLFSSPTHAAWQQDRLIDDSLFIDADSMTVAEIQSFLDGQGSLLANWVDNVDMYGSDGCVVHKATGMTAAEVIHEASTAWSAQIVNDCAGTDIDYWGDPEWSGYTLKTVSPKVMLATLQKEQGLISADGGYSTDPNAYPNTTGDCIDPGSTNECKLAWAVGYAVPDSGGTNTRYKGFYNQINWASWQLRYNFERSAGNIDWDGVGNLTYAGPMTEGEFRRCSSCALESFDGYGVIDGQLIYMSNRATASLYYYTPHTYPGFFGNFNFVQFYEQWFGPTDVDFDIIKGTSADLYVFSNGTKRLIPSTDVLTAWGFDTKPVTTLTDTALNAISTASPNLSRLAKDGGSLYFIDGGSRHGITSISQLEIWDLATTPAVAVGSDVLYQTSDANVLHNAVKNSSATLYGMSRRTIHPYASINVFAGWEGPTSGVTTLSDDFFATLTVGDTISSLKASDGGGNDYIVNSRSKLPLPSNVEPLYPGTTTTIDADTLAAMGTGSTATNVLKGESSSTLYLLDGDKIPITSISAAQSWTSGGLVATRLNDNAIASINTSSDLLSGYLADDGGQLYVISSGKKHLVPASLDGGYRNGSELSVSSNLLSTLADGPNATGLVRGVVNKSVFLLDGGEKLPIGNIYDYLLLVNGSSLSIWDDVVLGQFPTGETASFRFTSGSSTQYVIDEGMQYYQLADPSVWGFASNTVPDYEADTVARYTNAGTLQDSVSNNGTNYVGVSGSTYRSSNGQLQSLWSSNAPTAVSGSFIQRLSNNGELSIFVKSSSSASIYLYTGSDIRPISSFNTLFSYGYPGYGIQIVPQSFISGATQNSTLSTLLDVGGNTFILENGQRRPFATTAAENAFTNNGAATVMNLANEFDSLLPASSDTVTQTIKGTSATIYGVEAGQKRPIGSYQSYVDDWASFGLTILENSVLAQIPTGPVY